MESTYATAENVSSIDLPQTQVDPHFSDTATPDEQTRFITFIIGDSSYCIDAASVAEIANPIPHSYIPNAPPALAGLAPHRDEMVAVVGLKREKHKAVPNALSRPKLLVLHECRFPARVAFEIDRLIDVVSLPADSINETDDGSRSIRSNERSFQVISADEIYSLLRPPEK